MKRFLFTIGLMFVLAVPLCAQKLLPERLLLSTGQYVGSGSRALGLGGTYTGIADDYSAVWWNPAGLAQVKRIELQGSLSRTGYGNQTSYYGRADDGSSSALRLNNVGVVFPVPVYQGALSFAFGYTQVQAFDRRTQVVSPAPGTSRWDDFDELESGRLGMWSAAGAMDVSENLALGLGFNYWTGLDDYTLTGHYTENNASHYTENSISTDLSAWGANLGGLFRIGRFGRLGAMFQTPVSMSLEEDWQEGNDNGFFDYRMIYPAVFRVGASFCPGRWLLASDVEYRDWTSLEFRSETPFDSVSRSGANQQIKRDYQSTTRISFGGEYLFPAYGLRARAGYGFEPSSYKLSGGKDDRHIFSFGLGVLVDRSVMLDAAFRTTSYTEKTTPGLNEDISTTTALVTLSYRM
jgi:long-subunit fatty acid transport protein